MWAQGGLTLAIMPPPSLLSPRWFGATACLGCRRRFCTFSGRPKGETPFVGRLAGSASGVMEAGAKAAPSARIRSPRGVLFRREGRLSTEHVKLLQQISAAYRPRTLRTTKNARVTSFSALGSDRRGRPSTKWITPQGTSNICGSGVACGRAALPPRPHPSCAQYMATAPGKT